MTYYLTLENLLDLIAASEIGPVRDLGLLASGAHRPQTSLFGQDAYPSIDHKAAALLESLVRNHALVDGNKPLGWIAAMVFFGLNGITIEAPEDLAYDLVIAVATGQRSIEEIAAQLAQWH